VIKPRNTAKLSLLDIWMEQNIGINYYYSSLLIQCTCITTWYDISYSIIIYTWFNIIVGDCINNILQNNFDVIDLTIRDCECECISTPKRQYYYYLTLLIVYYCIFIAILIRSKEYNINSVHVWKKQRSELDRFLVWRGSKDAQNTWYIIISPLVWRCVSMIIL